MESNKNYKCLLIKSNVRTGFNSICSAIAMAKGKAGAATEVRASLHCRTMGLARFASSFSHPAQQLAALQLRAGA